MQMITTVIRWATVWATVSGAVLPGDASGQDERDAPRNLARTLFDRAAIDYWGDGPTLGRKRPKEEKSDQPSLPDRRTSLWAEPVRMPDGRTAIYVPPKAVLEFLENPTRKTGRAYVAWQEERMKRFKSAAAILEGLATERKEVKKTERKKDYAVLGEILYFKKRGCPYCDLEDREIAELARRYPRLKVRTVQAGQRPELWKEYGVRVVPTLVAIGRTGRKVLMRGYTPAAEVARILMEVDRDRK